MFDVVAIEPVADVTDQMAIGAQIVIAPWVRRYGPAIGDSTANDGTDISLRRPCFAAHLQGLTHLAR